jgi:DnaK suppressor protein
MLDDTTRQEIESRILDELADTEQKILDLEAATQPISPDKGLGRLTRMDAMQDKAVKEAALNQSRETLHHLEMALTKINEPTFGTCIGCQQPIPIERLVLLPQSTKCAPCAGC